MPDYLAYPLLQEAVLCSSCRDKKVPAFHYVVIGLGLVVCLSWTPGRNTRGASQASQHSSRIWASAFILMQEMQTPTPAKENSVSNSKTDRKGHPTESGHAAILKQPQIKWRWQLSDFEIGRPLGK